jgi:hypothetical protein
MQRDNKGKGKETRPERLDESERGSLSSERRPLLSSSEGNPAGNNVNPESQSSGLKAFLQATRRLGVQLKASRGNSEEYKPEHTSGAERNLQSDSEQMRLSSSDHPRSDVNKKEEKFGGVGRSLTGDTLGSSSQHKAKTSSPDDPHSDSELYSSDSDNSDSDNEEGFKVITRGLTYGFPAKSRNPETETVPNNPDEYRRKLVDEGFRPVPAQSLWEAIRNYFSSNRQKTEHLIRLKDAELSQMKYKRILDKITEKELKLAKELAKGFFEEDIKKIREYMKKNKDKEETEEYKNKKGELDTLNKGRSEFEESIRKKLSENTERSHERFIQDLKSMADRYGGKSGRLSLLKVSSLLRVGGLYQ